MPRVALVDYGSGNLRSAEKALVRAGADVAVTSDPDKVATAERIVLPGVGAFGDCMAGIEAIAGMRQAMEDAVQKRGVPFLGICVGMQLLADVGREFGEHRGLGWIAGEVARMAPGDPALKIPHMGWNELHIAHTHPLLDGIEDGTNVYFVHSYAFGAHNADDVIATTDYGGQIAAIVARDNIAGVQFHPEKSQAAGLRLLSNFLRWAP